jgi:hypothetical protein
MRKLARKQAIRDGLIAAPPREEGRRHHATGKDSVIRPSCNCQAWRLNTRDKCLSNDLRPCRFRLLATRRDQQTLHRPLALLLAEHIY